MYSKEMRTLLSIETPEPIPGLSIAGLRGSLLQVLFPQGFGVFFLTTLIGVYIGRQAIVL